MSARGSKDDDDYERSYDDDGNKGGSAMATLTERKWSVWTETRKLKAVLSAEEQESNYDKLEAKNIVARRYKRKKRSIAFNKTVRAVVRLDRSERYQER